MVRARSSVHGYVCQLCSLARCSQTLTVRRDFSSYALRRSTSEAQATKFVKQRVQQLGGGDSLPQQYPRLQHGQAEPLSVDSYLEKAEQFDPAIAKDVTDRNACYNVYGTLRYHWQHVNMPI